MARSENNKPLEEVIAKLQFNDSGLIPAIAQDHVTREVLMMAWMNEGRNSRNTQQRTRMLFFAFTRKIMA